MPPALALLALLLSSSSPSPCQEVWLELESSCREEEVEECPADCQPGTRRECQILMKKVWSPVLVTECLPGAGDDQGRCEDGEQTHCTVRFSTRCQTRRRYAEIEEDQPVCRTEKEGEVEVNRCQVVRRRRRKMLPETSCRRVPRTECHTRPCEEPAPAVRCGRRLKLVGEYRPQEECRLVRRDCCGKVVRTVCSPADGQEKIKQTVCNGTIIP